VAELVPRAGFDPWETTLGGSIDTRFTSAVAKRAGRTWRRLCPV
jgi:hypothetical protein